MSKSRFPRIAFVVLAAVAAVAASAQTTQFDLFAGVQWVDLEGNEDMYRSQVNEDDGFVLRSLSLLVVNDPGSGAFIDRFRLDAADIGGSPQGRFRIEAGRARAFSVRMSYFRAEHYSALPSFANPFQGDGIVPGQHTLDRTLESFGLDLELLPGRAVTPLLGYSRHRYDGPGLTTFHVGQDEFQLRSEFEETVDEFRAGLAFHAGSFHGRVLQGWRTIESRDRFELVAGGEGGNSSRPILGRDVSLDAFSRSSSTDIDAPVTSGHLTGRIGDRARVVGSFVSGEADADTSESESLSGSLVSFALRRFFGGLESTASSSAENPYWRGNARIEAEIVDDVDLVVGVARRHREKDGSALIEELYLDTVNYSGYDPKDLAELVEVENALERDERVFDARLTVRELGPVRAWVDWSMSEQEVTLEESAAEVVLPGGQGGTFDRGVDAVGVGAALRVGGFELSGEWRQEEADAVVLRTDFTDRERWRVRAGWKCSVLQILGTADMVDARAAVQTAESEFNLMTRHWGGDIILTPAESFTLRASYGLYKTDTEYTYRVPERFTEVPSLYAEDGELVEGGLIWHAGRAGSFDLGYSRFENSGSLPFELTRGWLRYSVDFSKTVGAAVEVDSHDYSETLLPLADFEATRYGVFLRWHH